MVKFVPLRPTRSTFPSSRRRSVSLSSYTREPDARRTAVYRQNRTRLAACLHRLGVWGPVRVHGHGRAHCSLRKIARMSEIFDATRAGSTMRGPLLGRWQPARSNDRRRG